MTGLTPEHATPHSSEEKRVRQPARSRARFEGISPWFQERFPEIIHPDLTTVYRQFVDTLSPNRRNIQVENNLGTFTRSELADHVELGDEVGKVWAETMYEGTYSELSPGDRDLVRSNPELLVQMTIAQFQSAIEKRTVGSEPK